MGKGKIALAVLGGLVAVAVGGGAMYAFGPAAGGGEPTVHAVKQPPEALRLDRTDRAFPLTGTVTAEGIPLDDATITVGEQSVTTDETGTFSLGYVPLGPVTVSRPAFLPTEFTFDGTAADTEVALEGRVVRALYVPPVVAGDDADFQALVDLASITSVNAFVFDTKGDHDGGYVFYETEVQAANDAGAVRVWYDPETRLQQVHDAGMYAITRIPAFISSKYTAKYPEHRLVTQYLDPGNRAAWEYPLNLAVEACTLGFDEIQFDYVRYPESYNKAVAPNQDARVANIKAFLEEAVVRLHPLGCAVSADVFGIVNVANDDQGIGQLIDEISIPLDVYSPMIYPEQWSNIGSLIGIAQPTSNPGGTVGAVLDAASPRIAEGVLIRPFLQAYSLKSSGIAAEIAAAEERGCGWLLWNVAGNYSADALPAGTTGVG